MGTRNIQTYLEMIKVALQECRVLSFDYEDRYGNRSARTAEPCQLILKGSNWYWQGYCRSRNDFRLFKLSRMSNLQLEQETFQPRLFEKPQLDFTERAASMQRGHYHPHSSISPGQGAGLLLPGSVFIGR